MRLDKQLQGVPKSSVPRHPLKAGFGGLLCIHFVTFFTAFVTMTADADVTVRGRLKPSDRVVESQTLVKPVFTKSASSGSAEVVSSAALSVGADTPPEICFGHGSLNTISFTDWEAGLGSWTVGRRNVSNPQTFSTEDWKAVGSLPDGRPGNGAFIANLTTGNCSSDDETGVLFMTSPSIALPVDALVPRVSFDHWFVIEQGWDGGNLKLSVNGGFFQLVPITAIEFNYYERRLFAASEGNTNPLAPEHAYTGANNGLSGAWQEVRVNLTGLAQPGDSIRLRFEFGIDGCLGEIGWYVDNVRFYSCSDELPPSACGNVFPDPDEQCDDGNDFIGDGCSNTCQVDAGWQCTVSLPPARILDNSFEAGTPNPNWIEASTNFGTPVCSELSCGLGTGSGPGNEEFWAWFGGIEVYEESSLQQSVTIPSTATKLTFELEASTCDSGDDYLEVRVDGVREFLINGDSPLCGKLGYITQDVDISTYADDQLHTLEFHAETFGTNLDVTNFFVDDVAIPGRPSKCFFGEQPILRDGFESN